MRCDCGHLQAHHTWSSSEAAAVGSCTVGQCKCRAYVRENLPHATPIDGSAPACVDSDGKTARERLAEREVSETEYRSSACECGHPDLVHGISGCSQCTACRQYVPIDPKRLRTMLLARVEVEKQRGVNWSPRSLEPAALAEYIFAWLERRNRGELREALGAQRVSDRRLAVEELELILKHGGKPPNWSE